MVWTGDHAVPATDAARIDMRNDPVILVPCRRMTGQTKVQGEWWGESQCMHGRGRKAYL